MLDGRLDVATLEHQFPELRLLVLHGSRARESAHAGSDWDFGYVADTPFDELGLRLALSKALDTDHIDLANLARASAVLRYRAASDGRPLLERSRGEFELFALSAIRFWLDVEPILRRAHAEVLDRLG
jgi:predicted nucleotidyltransferase